MLLALGLAALAAAVDVLRMGALGRIYQVAFAMGCVAAVCLVRRRNLFGPIVQPPLVFAVTAIGSIVLLGPKSGDGLKQLLFSVALPLTSNFPTMGITTAVVVTIGVGRLFLQRDPGSTEEAPPAADAAPQQRKERLRPPREERPAREGRPAASKRPVRDGRKPAREPRDERGDRPKRRPRPDSPR